MIPVPFKNIAVSLSGGGYRATAFHLGALSYFDATEHEGARLIEHVKIISTISGGTLTGVMYALKLAEGGDFKDCYYRLYKLLFDDELVDHALDKLNNPRSWKNKHKTRDLINAFAEVYNEHFYDEATFAKLFDSDKSHLTDVIFGSSEFTYGIQFRFQEEHDRGKFGNGYLNIPDNVAREIRLADAAAASSCFPGGFEPLVMPKDFGNGPDSLVDLTWYSKNYQGTPYQTTALVDGGVIDNQGIEGVKLAEDRHTKDDGPFIGTYIVSDVSGDVMAPYKVPKFTHNHFKNFFSFNTINLILGAVVILISVCLYCCSLPLWGIIIASCVLTLIVVWYLIFFYVKSAVKDAISTTFAGNNLPEILKDLRVLLRTPVYILVYLVKFRISSVLKMVMDVFLRRIRRLQLDSLYASPDWNYRFKSNYIYSLKYNDEIPTNMQDVVKAANTMPTTLWFSEQEKADGVLDSLIACGQFTQCFNLIKYIDRIQNDTYREKVWDFLKPEEQQSILSLRNRMSEDWDKFLINPYWLVEQYKKNKKVVA